MTELKKELISPLIESNGIQSDVLGIKNFAEEEPPRMYFINRTKGSCGKFKAHKIMRIPDGTGRVIIKLEFEKQGRAKDKVDYYLNEDEWLNDVKEM